MTQASGAERRASSRLNGKGFQHLNFPNECYDFELLELMGEALDAAWSDQQRYFSDDITSRALRTAMAFQIMTAVGSGERDPEQLKLAALIATAGRSLDC